MTEADRLKAENAMLRTQLSGLTEAILRISEDLDIDKVLQEVVDSARRLAGARYAAIMVVDSSGELQDWLFSGLTDQELRTVLSYGAADELFKHLSAMPDPLRISDFALHLEDAGFSGFEPRIGDLMSAQIRVRDVQVGTIFLGKEHNDAGFSPADEEILEMFASQAATAMTNARRYGDEQRARTDLEALVNTSPVGVLVVDVPAETMVVVNQEAIRLIHADPDSDSSMAGLERLSFKRMDGAEVAAEDLPFMQALRNGETVRAEELVIVRPDGSEVATLVNATPIHSDKGELVTVIATMQDMSPLEDFERLRAEFLAMVSHELRAPLTSIKGSAATMRGTSAPSDPAEMLQFFRIVEDQADHMRDMINDLLDVTRIEAGSFSVTLEPLNVESVIEQARNVFLSGGHRHPIDIETTAKLPQIWGDRQRIVQVLHNLFSNAAPTPGLVDDQRLGFAGDTHVAVSVTDEGAESRPSGCRCCSPSTRKQPRRFREQPEPLRSRLAICKGIVEAHGGRSGEERADGRGAEFTFTIPASINRPLRGAY